MERFFDESGGTQLVIHSPYGSRMNRAWGLALRKRFCRKFNFELQAAATEDAIILSLSTSHSFPLDEVTRYLHSSNVRDVLTQAMLDAPMFALRWRWNAVSALALPRYTGGTRVAPQLQRMKSEDLLATVFPDQVACAENLVGERQVPDHPLVAQTIHDCLHEAMDIEALEALLRGVESGEIEIRAHDLTQPSPLAAEVLGSAPYTFLDDAPLEERRTQAVQNRRAGDVERADDLGKLDADAIAAVRDEAWPGARDADELHDALMSVAYLAARELDDHAAWPAFAATLAKAGRATRLTVRPAFASTACALSASAAAGDALWVATERVPWFDALHPEARREPSVTVPEEYRTPVPGADEALVEILRARLTALGPVRAARLADELATSTGAVEIALTRLESEGYVMRGRFTPDAAGEEWCERHLLARIHRYTVHRLRREIEPVEPRDFVRFLFDWQKVSSEAQMAGPDALEAVIAQLEGFEAPAASWEAELLPARVAGYEIGWLDDLCRAGRVAWSRPHHARDAQRERAAGPVRGTPITLLQRRHLRDWASLAAPPPDATPSLSSRAQAVADHLAAHGASFFDEIADGARLLRAELEDALGELVALGLASADSFAGLRALLVPSSKRVSSFARRGRRGPLMGLEEAGRWSLVKRAPAPTATTPPRRPSFDPDAIEHVARTLLRRYGVVFWRVLEREADWLPPWRELVRVFHRLEARGEIRGGRFVAGLTGEQFALPQAVAALRAVRARPHDGAFVGVCGADPLNLVGTVLVGARVPAVAGSRIVYRDGVPVATMVAGQLTVLETLDGPDQARLRAAITASPRRARPPTQPVA